MAAEYVNQDLRDEFLEAVTSVDRPPGLDEFIWFVEDNERQLDVSWSDQHEGKVAYSPKMGVRQACTLGRFMRRQWEPGKYIEDARLDEFVSSVLAMKDDLDDRIMVVCGEDIMDLYEEEWGYHSCMTGECSKYTEIYAENGICSMIKYEYGNTRARALVWETDQGDTAVDRVYPNDGQHVQSIARWAKEQGWIMREHQSLPGSNAGKVYDKPYSVTFSVDSYWPYMDSFRFIEKLPGCGLYIAWSSIEGCSGPCRVAESTEGILYDRLAIACSCCEGLVRLDEDNDREEAIASDEVDVFSMCSSCRHKKYAYIRSTRVWVPQREAAYICDSGNWELKESIAQFADYCCSCDRYFSAQVHRNDYLGEDGSIKKICFDCARSTVDQGLITYTSEAKAHKKRSESW